MLDDRSLEEARHMFTGIRIAAINAGKAAGGAIVFGACFTLGAAVTKASLQALSNAANKLADKKTDKARVTKATEVTSTVSAI